MSSASTTMMMTTTTTCTTEGCCRPFSESSYRLNITTTTTTNSSSAAAAITKETLPMIAQEIYKTALHVPTSLGRLASEVFSHFFVQPKKPQWNIQQTIVMAFLQSFRDQTLTNSLEFWRVMLIAPTWLTPLTSKIQDGSFHVRRRHLHGVLRELDQQEEDGSRILEVEWMSAGTILDRCQSMINPGTDTRLGDNNNINETQKQNSTALILRSRSPEKMILYLHGGAYCSMSAQTHRTLTHKISKSTGRRVFGK